ncbi:MAG: hypothetical protein CL908_21415 [Deltaproteobacteria bacterium]|nr:hypothetical protein [Deltaproteobacteria bacterium]
MGSLAGRLEAAWRRRSALALVGLTLVGLATWAVLDVSADEKHQRAVANAALQDLTAVAGALFAADEARFAGMLERARVELRAQGLWQNKKAGSEPGVEAWEDVEGRRLAASVRRALGASEGVLALELVVAGHDGLWSWRFEQDALPAPAAGSDPRERERMAKALWYADEVLRAVASNGRAVEWGDIVFEPVSDAGRVVLRVAIGLHAPGELVQGALVASLDLGGIAGRLEGLAGRGFQLSVLTPDGRRPAAALATADSYARAAALAARAVGSTESAEVFVADGQLVYGAPLAHVDGSIANLLMLAETPVPPSGASAWLATPWLPCLIALALVSTLASVLLLSSTNPRPLSPSSGQGAVAGEACDASEEGAEDGAIPAPEIVVTREGFVLREWLADVRSCLEREAATRSLRLDLRCEKSLPAELDQDPAWLGGLVVAMGREALDTASGGWVSLEVAEDVDDTLRFEIAAADSRLGPVCGMQEVAERIGGHIEEGREGRMALVVPQALG